VMYPENWPKCRCGEPCMDGKGTCGNVACNVVRVDLPPPTTRYGTMTMGAFINAMGDAANAGRHEALDEMTKQAQDLDMGY